MPLLASQIRTLSGLGLIIVSNYSALPAANTVPDKAYFVEDSQGTAWLPGNWGGTYYPAGTYYSNGTTWKYTGNPYQATQGTVDAGIVTDQFVTPNTLANSTWAFTVAKVLATTLSGLSVLTGGTITSTDTILQAFGKLQYQISNIDLSSYLLKSDKASVSDINTGIDDTKYTTALGLESSKYLTQYGTKLYATVSGTNTYTATLTPAISSYQTGATYRLKFTNANTSTTPTINLNSLGAKTLVRRDGTALASGDIVAGGIYLITYDGTNFYGDFGLATKVYVDTVDALKANLASPTFTGTPLAPTASPNTNNTQIATTAYVDAKRIFLSLSAGSTNPIDSTTYYWGSYPTLALTNVASNRRVYPSVACTLTEITINTFIGGTLGSGENVAYYIYKNGSSSGAWSLGNMVHSSTNNVLAATGGTMTFNGTTDYFEVVLITPAYVTNPTTVHHSATLAFKTTG